MRNRPARGAQSRTAVFAALAVFSIVSLPVYAYTDPGSGALMLQLLLASLTGAAFYFRRGLAWVSRRLLGKPAVEEPRPNPIDEHLGNDS